MKPIAIGFVLLAGCPPTASNVPCARESSDASWQVAFEAVDGGPVDAGAGDEVSKASNQEGTLRIFRRVERTHAIFYASWHGSEAPVEVQLDGLVDAKPTFRMLDVNGDGILDVLADRGPGPSAYVRFALFLSNEERSGIDGQEEPFVWRWLVGIDDLDAAAAALAKLPRTDFSIPEVCGMLDHVPRGGVETYAWDSAKSGWVRSKTKRGPEWSCAQLVQDGPGYWMPELRCSHFVPACEAMLISGGHGGTTLPHETQIFFERARGILELRAVQINDH